MIDRLFISLLFVILLVFLSIISFLLESEVLSLLFVNTSIFCCLFILLRGKYLVSIENFLLLIGWLYSNGLLFIELTNTNVLLFVLINVSTIIIFIMLRLLRVTEILQEKKIKIVGNVDVSIAPLIAIFISLLGLSILIYVVTVKTNVSQYIFITRAERASIYRGIGVLALFREMIISGGLLLFYCYLVTQKVIYKYGSIIILLVALVHALVTISRAELILIIIPLVFMLRFFDKIGDKKIIYFVIFLVPFVFLWKSILFLIFFNSHGEINYSISELVSWYHIGQDVINDISKGNLDYIYGKSFVDGFISLIYPFYDTTPLSVWYSRDVLAIYDGGAGRGFSMVVESYLNFGVVGVLIVMPFFSIILYGLLKVFSKTFLYPYVYCVIPAFMYKIFRAEFYSLIKTFWWIFVIPTLFVLLFNVIFKQD